MQRELAFPALLLALLGTGAVALLRPWNRELGASAPTTLSSKEAQGTHTQELHPVSISAPAEARMEETGKESRDQRQSPTRQVTGRVIFPDDTPRDEKVEVVLEHVPLQADGTRDVVSEFEGNWQEAARAPAAADGSFALAIPQGVGFARVNLAGRYLYLERPVTVENNDSPPVVELRPLIGAWATFVLAPPTDTGWDPQCLVGRRITMWHAPRDVDIQGTPPTMSFVVKPDLTLNGAGLPANDSFEVCRQGIASDENLGLSPYLVLQGWDPQLTAGAHTRLEIPLLDGAQISGTVCDNSGAPVEDAMVQVGYSYANGGNYWYDSTDAEGRFELEAIHPAFQVLRAEKDGFKSAPLRGSDLGVGIQRTGLRLVLSRVDKPR
jgi:hypothetical protein